MRAVLEPKAWRAMKSRVADHSRSRWFPQGNSRGFSLIEVVVSSVVTIIAVMGLAHLFGIGRALINHDEVARAADGVAQQRFELLARLSPSSGDLVVGTHQDTVTAFTFQGVKVGTQTWTVAWFDDPLDGLGAIDPNPKDLKRVTVMVKWGKGVEADSLNIVRLFASS